MPAPEKFAQRTRKLAPEGAYQVLARAQALEAAGRDIIHFEIGQPDFDTFPNIAEAGRQAISRGFTRWKVVIPPRYDNVLSFAEGLAPVKIGPQWGYIDKTGSVVIQPQFEFAFPFSEEQAPVKVGYKWGYIFKTGQFAIRPKFEGAYPFQEGLAIVKIGRATGYIDKTGRYMRIL